MMRKQIKTLTIRKLPEEVADAVRKRAEEGGMSFSKAFVALLQEHLGIVSTQKKKKCDLSQFAGAWSEKEYKDFMESLAEQRRIDPEMWK